MISENNITYFQELLAYIIYYGIDHNYSFSSIQNKLLNSSLVYFLENNKANQFAYRVNEEELIKQIYNINNDIESIKLDSTCRWVANSYIDLFYEYHKSFSYLFLLFPLEEMFDIYVLYHEMDIQQLFRLYEKRNKEIKILPALLKKKKISIRELSLLTGISENTLTHYCRDNANLYNANIKNITMLCDVLDVDLSIFKENINNDVDYSTYEFDRRDYKYRSYLALLLIQYYYPDFVKESYCYNEKRHTLESQSNNILIEFVDSGDNINNKVEDISNSKIDISKTNLVIFEYDSTNDDINSYKELNEIGFKNIFVINDLYIKRINIKTSIHEISASIYTTLMKRAKQLAKSQ